MATRKARVSKSANVDPDADSVRAKQSDRKRTTPKSAAKKTARRESSSPKTESSKVGKTGPKSASPKPARKARSTSKRKVAPKVRKEVSAAPMSGEERDRRCLRLIHAACLKSGSAAIGSSLVGKVPMMAKLAPLLIGSLADRDTLPRTQRQLVLDILALYEIRLNELEERAVVLLATAVGGSAREISQRSLEQLVDRSGISQFGGALGRPIIARLLPIATLASDGASTITATYAIGRRAQALCRIGNGQAQDLGELLHGLTGIDQRRLISWSGSAFRLAVSPFRAALGAVGGSNSRRD